MSDLEDYVPPSKYLVLVFWYNDSKNQDRYSFIRDTAVQLDSSTLDRREAINDLIHNQKSCETFWLYQKDGKEINGGLTECLLLGWGGE